ncbi:MAG: hypothetical protein IJM51_00920 [Clostridia bacterium]|nr:hypothetical protein [Clostridia bacterium]
MIVSSFTKRLCKVAAAVVMLSTCFLCFSGVTAFAAVDLDITIVPPDDTVTNGSDCEVDLEILTKSDNGYTEMVMYIEYDEDLLRLAAPVNQNGYRVVGSRGKLTLSYTDPTGTKTQTPIGNKETVPIHFIVLDDAPDTTTKIRANIDHAYNKKGKNVTWTPIYDKSIEIIRINQDVNNSDTSSEEESSQFVVGGGTNLINRSGDGATGGGAGKVIGVVIGAIVIFSAGMAAGNLFCMKRFGLTSGSAKKDGREEDYYHNDDDDDDDGYDDEYAKPEKGRAAASGRNVRPEGYGSVNDDGFYTRPGQDYTVGGDDDYLTPVPVNRTSGDSFPDIFGTSAVGARSADAADFSSLFGEKGKTDSAPKSQSAFPDDDEYPALFASNRPKQPPRKAPAAPTFDTGSETLFGRFSANVERNVDDGYGGLSSSRSRDRSERSPRNR